MPAEGGLHNEPLRIMSLRAAPAPGRRAPAARSQRRRGPPAPHAVGGRHHPRGLPATRVPRVSGRAGPAPPREPAAVAQLARAERRLAAEGRAVPDDLRGPCSCGRIAVRSVGVRDASRLAMGRPDATGVRARPAATSVLWRSTTAHRGARGVGRHETHPPPSQPANGGAPDGARPGAAGRGRLGGRDSPARGRALVGAAPQGLPECPP